MSLPGIFSVILMSEIMNLMKNIRSRPLSATVSSSVMAEER